VPVHEIVGLKESLPPTARECLKIFNEGLDLHYQRDWAGAIARFRQSAEIELNIPGKTPGVVSNPSLVYIKLVEHYVEDPPPQDWTGEYVMKEK
jgi:hypothetical protein